MKLMNFSYKSLPIRTVVISGEPHFVLTDLASVLDIKEVSRLASRLDDGLRLMHPIEDTMGRIQQTTLVNESGMYEVVIRSDKPEAKAFRRWITSEVLPSVRKTGGYQLAQLALPSLELEGVGVKFGQPITTLPGAVSAKIGDPRARRWEAVANYARNNPDLWHPVTIDGFTDKHYKEAANAIKYGARKAFVDRTFDAAVRDGQLFVRHNTPQPELTLAG